MASKVSSRFCPPRAVPTSRKLQRRSIQQRAYEVVPYIFFGQYSPASAVRTSVKGVDKLWRVPNPWVLDK